MIEEISDFFNRVGVAVAQVVILLSSSFRFASAQPGPVYPYMQKHLLAALPEKSPRQIPFPLQSFGHFLLLLSLWHRSVLSDTVGHVIFAFVPPPLQLTTCPSFELGQLQEAPDLKVKVRSLLLSHEAFEQAAWKSASLPSFFVMTHLLSGPNSSKDASTLLP